MKTPTDEMYGTIARLFDRFNQEQRKNIPSTYRF